MVVLPGTDGHGVRLEIPLVARRHPERIDRVCADSAPLGRRGLTASRTRDAAASVAEAEKVLACIARLWDVTLDGTRLEPGWEFLSAPGEGVTGVVAYLPTTGLRPGAHTLEVAETGAGVDGAADPRDEADGDDADGDDAESRPQVHYIRFRT